MVKGKIPEFYIFFVKRLKEKNNSDVVKKRKLMNYLGVLYHIPKDRRINFLKELEKNKLIKPVSRDSVEICI